ncbi:uncharacterized protein L199_001134 [Kwoniella botswanensis]|uniref:uncharacterized protein n=1 Tax=Kwoniella botswanensis TaxID=1268659 RepID=UPI00315C9888
MSTAFLGNTVLWGDPIYGEPRLLQLAANDNATDAVEAGLKVMLEPHRGVFLGPVMIGFIADFVLLGVMLAQLIKWGSYAVEDRWFIKIIVAWCTLFGAISSIFNLAYIHHVFVNNFGIYTTFTSADWSSWLAIIASSTSAGVQVFYCDRAYKLSGKNKILGGIISAFILTSIIGGIGSKITFGSTTTQTSDATKATILIYLYTAGAMAADFLITTSIMWSLSRSKSGFVQTDQIVNKLLAVSAETQLPPTLMAISFLIIFAYKTTKAAAHPDEIIIDVTSNLTGFFMMTMPKTYVVGFLAVLNSRMSLRAVMTSKDASSQQRKANTYQLKKRTAEGNVKVTTETYVQAERYDPATQAIARQEGELDKTPHTSQTGLTFADALKESRV